MQAVIERSAADLVFACCSTVTRRSHVWLFPPTPNGRYVFARNVAMRRYGFAELMPSEVEALEFILQSDGFRTCLRRVQNGTATLGSGDMPHGWWWITTRKMLAGSAKAWK